AEEAARVLGATRLRAFITVTLPRLAPALWSAAVIVFLFCFTSFGVILTVGGPGNPTVETEIWRYATQRTDFGTAAGLAVVQLVTVVALVLTGNALERRASASVAGSGRGASAPRRFRGWRQRVAAASALAPALL